MGPLRRGLIGATALGLIAAPAWASSCTQVRPHWVPGTEVSVWEEALALGASPIALVLIVASMLCLRFRAQWATLVVVLLWTALVAIVTFTDFGGRAAAAAEGCIGSPALFIAVVTALSVGMILYTAPRARQD